MHPRGVQLEKGLEVRPRSRVHYSCHVRDISEIALAVSQDCCWEEKGVMTRRRAETTKIQTAAMQNEVP